MRVLLILLVLLLVAVVIFSVQNPGRVDVAFLVWEFRSPLLLVGLVIFALGALAGLAAMAPYYFRRRLESRRLRKDLYKERERPAGASAAGFEPVQARPPDLEPEGAPDTMSEVRSKPPDA